MAESGKALGLLETMLRGVDVIAGAVVVEVDTAAEVRDRVLAAGPLGWSPIAKRDDRPTNGL